MLNPRLNLSLQLLAQTLGQQLQVLIHSNDEQVKFNRTMTKVNLLPGKVANILFGIIAVLFILYIICVFPLSVDKRAGFRSVLDTESFNYIDEKTDEIYLIKNGRLYLRFRKYQVALFNTYFIPYQWTIPKIQEFRNTHPELEDKWPDPSAKNGGVQWIK